MPTSTYIALATFTATGTETGVTFSSIPATYRDLVVQGNVKGNTANGQANLNLNGDTGNQSGLRMTGSGSGSGYSDLYYQFPIGAEWGTWRIHIMDYSATDKHKTALIRGDNPAGETHAAAYRWASTNAVISVGITTNRTFQLGTTLTLYGIVS